MTIFWLFFLPSSSCLVKPKAEPAYIAYWLWPAYINFFVMATRKPIFLDQFDWWTCVSIRLTMCCFGVYSFPPSMMDVESSAEPQVEKQQEQVNLWELLFDTACLRIKSQFHVFNLPSLSPQCVCEDEPQKNQSQCSGKKASQRENRKKVVDHDPSSSAADCCNSWLLLHPLHCDVNSDSLFFHVIRILACSFI